VDQPVVHSPSQRGATRHPDPDPHPSSRDPHPNAHLVLLAVPAGGPCCSQRRQRGVHRALQWVHL